MTLPTHVTRPFIPSSEDSVPIRKQMPSLESALAHRTEIPKERAHCGPNAATVATGSLAREFISKRTAETPPQRRFCKQFLIGLLAETCSSHSFRRFANGGENVAEVQGKSSEASGQGEASGQSSPHLFQNLRRTRQASIRREASGAHRTCRSALRGRRIHPFVFFCGASPQSARAARALSKELV